MKRIGIIGGLGPEATVDYYKRITSHFHASNKSLSTPEILIYSVDISKLLSIVAAQDLDTLVDWLVSKLCALESAGADFAAISANTPHIVFDDVLAKSPLPLISIVESTLDSAKSLGFKKVGLLGTSFTMRANFFGKRFAKEGINVAVPTEQEQAFIHEKLVTEIEHGVFTDETRASLSAIIEKLRAREGIEAVILGCTELPLILTPEHSSVRLLNTTELHVAAICDYCAQPL